MKTKFLYQDVDVVSLADKYKKRLLIKCIHHFKSDLINNMDHMRISGTEDVRCFV